MTLARTAALLFPQESLRFREVKPVRRRHREQVFGQVLPVEARLRLHDGEFEGSRVTLSRLPAEAVQIQRAREAREPHDDDAVHAPGGKTITLGANAREG
jgi:hypothetical protein